LKAICLNCMVDAKTAAKSSLQRMNPTNPLSRKNYL